MRVVSQESAPTCARTGTCQFEHGQPMRVPQPVLPSVREEYIEWHQSKVFRSLDY